MPYRIKVLLLENKRVDGRVKQETVAVLGSIEAIWLESFWQGHNPNLRKKVWQNRSLRERTYFWKICNERLARLQNRLGPDLKATRIAVHKRVPWPMKLERLELERLEALAEVEDKEWLYEHVRKRAEVNEETLTEAQKEKTRLGFLLLTQARKVVGARDKVARIEQRKKAEEN